MLGDLGEVLRDGARGRGCVEVDDLRGALGELSEEAFLHERALVHRPEGFFVPPFFVVVEDEQECVDDVERGSEYSIEYDDEHSQRGCREVLNAVPDEGAACEVVEPEDAERDVEERGVDAPVEQEREWWTEDCEDVAHGDTLCGSIHQCTRKGLPS